MQAALAPVLKQHVAERNGRNAELDKAITAGAAAAAALSHNCVAACGMQLQSAANNANTSAVAVKSLKTSIAEVGKAIGQQQASVEGLYLAIASTGSVASWVSDSDNALGRIRSHFAAIEASLTAEDH